MSGPTDYRERSIGIFDSGFGGLTVMKEVIKALPLESIIYFGDTARLPYGEKSAETIIRYSIENTIFLLEQKIKIVVVACNTASAYALDKLRQIFNIPVIGVIEPGVEKAVQVTRNGKIAVLGTKATIRSEIYQKEIKKRLPNATVIPVACSLFVPLVEESYFDHPAARLIVADYLQLLLEENVDTILLGCTHYPLLEGLIRDYVGDSITLVDSATTCSEQVSTILREKNLESYDNHSAHHRFYVSDDPVKFQMMGEIFLGTALPEVGQKNS